jgi:hypothetical protein
MTFHCFRAGTGFALKRRSIRDPPAEASRTKGYPRKCRRWTEPPAPSGHFLAGVFKERWHGRSIWGTGKL